MIGDGMISYEEIFSRALNKIDDPKELLLDDNDLLEIYLQRLHSAVSKPFIRKLFSSIAFDDEIQEFSFVLTDSVDANFDKDFVLELLALGIAIEWLEPKVKSLKNTAKFFGGKEEKKLKDDYSLNKDMLREMKIEQQKFIRDHGYAFKSYSKNDTE